MAATADPRAKPPAATSAHHLEPWGQPPPTPAHRLPPPPSVLPVVALPAGGDAAARDRRRSSSNRRGGGGGAAAQVVVGEDPFDGGIEELRPERLPAEADSEPELKAPPPPPLLPLAQPQADGAARPWNLRQRTRRRPAASMSWAAAAVPVPSSSRRRKRAPFSVALTPEEIEEDIYALTGSRPRRRPRKRPRVVQRQLDNGTPAIQTQTHSDAVPWVVADGGHRRRVPSAGRVAAACSGTAAAAAAARQSAVTLVYRAEISGHSRLVTVTWCRNLLTHGLSVSIEGSAGNGKDKIGREYGEAAVAATDGGGGGGGGKSCSACKVEMQPWHFWRKYGAKQFQVDGNAIDVVWDLRSARFSDEPEPLSDYYVAVVAGEEVVLLLGNLKKDAFRRTGSRPSLQDAVLVCKKEHVYWDAHDWLFGTGMRHALFIFKPEPPSPSPPGASSEFSTDEYSDFCLFLYAWKVE
uniref:Uncharacterized protein n=1 Tax=Oryza meridionalis TaxID=40149 RepID=A0A0E0DUI1_9ORYZ